MRHRRPLLSSLAVAGFASIVLGASCRSKTEPVETEPVETEPVQAGAVEEYVEVATVTGGFKTPESVLHDSEADVYLVSNLAAGPFGGEAKGFISRIRPDGTVEKLAWIRGGADGATLDAPKGMAIVGGVLWVADIAVVRKFDRMTGKPLGDVAIAGASFLNDLAAGPDGTVYVSDSGFAKDFSSTGSDAVHAIGPDGSVRTLAKGGRVSAPNGLLATPEGLFVATWTGGEVLRVASDGAVTEVAKLPQAKLDGIVAGADGSMLVSSWDGSCVYRVSPPAPAAPCRKDLRSPADIGWDAKRGRLLVPLFEDDKVVILGKAGS